MSVDQVSTREYESQVMTKAAKTLYVSEKMADVHFIFKSGERVPAHKYLLAAASDVFEAMFYGSIKEKSDVKIDDASSIGFKEFLQFFYFNKIKLTMANINDVLNLGQKYNVTECFDLCVRFLEEHLTTDNVYQVHSLALLFEQTFLKEKCEGLIISNTEEVLQSPSFLECDKNTLNHILKLDDLSCSETIVFNAVMSWVKAISKQEKLTKEIIQTYLGDSFREIRFRSMTYDEFVDLLPSFGELFTGNELIEILQMIRDEKFQPKTFNALARTFNPLHAVVPWDEEAILKCNRFIKCSPGKPYHIHNVETTTFTTNTPLLLGYFLCSPIYGVGQKMKNSIPVVVTIVRIQNDIQSKSKASMVTALYTMKTELDKEDQLTSMKKKLSKPIVIDPKFKYEIRMNLNISEDCAAYREMRSEVHLQSDIIVKFHNDPVINGKTRGLVYELGFNRCASLLMDSIDLTHF